MNVGVFACGFQPSLRMVTRAVRRPKASAYAKRTARGRFKEMDDVGRSQKADKPRKAKRSVSSGYGDQGDERRRAPRKTRR